MVMPSQRRTRAFTLVELLVVIAIIGILVALLLPAVQAAREAARRTECINHLKQMGVGCQNFHDVNKYFPTGGTVPWSTYNRYGDIKPDPTAAVETEQHSGGVGPGWAFQILPYMEQATLYEHQDFLAVRNTVVPFYFCPSRRASATYGSQVLMDYAGATPGTRPYPSSDDFWQQGDHWKVPQGNNFNGVIVRSGYSRRVTFGGIPDGSSNVLLIGEKMIRSHLYETGDWHDDCGWSDGWDPDIMRYTAFRPYPDQENNPAPDGQDVGYHFGGAHPAGFTAVLADGSTRVITFDIDPTVFNNLGHRLDGTPLPEF